MVAPQFNAFYAYHHVVSVLQDSQVCVSLVEQDFIFLEVPVFLAAIIVNHAILWDALHVL
jgi:hypothetical protein